ncbi:DEAD/DEAH box helicase [Miltoncostaea marina]|uniref:DEAD/DEAH box helicase n=1 Tax=Miltoncostaea marina TaxID=2843215 RepID=UPI001C3D384B|nr:DEAD/DEAH box helicase [Miltoncostaea marina]
MSTRRAPMTGSRRLYPFQEDGVRALIERPAVLLADDMGLGKTVQAATAMARLAAAGELNRALIVAPRGLLTQWRAALEEWAPGLSVIRVDGGADERAWRWRAAKNVFLTGYEVARNDAGVLRRRPWDLVVLDEAQRIKNPDAATSAALKRIPRLRAWALTGTPLENRVEDLASILEFVAPNRDGGAVQPLRPGSGLWGRQAEVQLRRRKEDVLGDLPPKTVVTVELRLGREQRRAYEALEGAARSRLRALGEDASVMNVLEAITRLKQVCNYCPDTGRSAKQDDLLERMDEIAAAGNRALVFSQWTNERFGAARIAVGLARFRPLVYSGALSAEERDGVVRRFSEDPERRALVLSLRAGGQGLNLQQASYVVHFDRWWNPAVEDQATDRSHRAGQRYPVTVYEYVCGGTIEERIQQILDDKRALFRSLVDGVSMDLSRTLSPTELFGLLGLSAPRRLRTVADDAEPLARTRAVLEATGWSVRQRPEDVRSSVALKAERVDELGRRVALWFALARAPDDERRLAELVAALPGDGESRGVLVVSGTPAEGLRDAAERAGVEVWAGARRGEG